jgi:hypothetical protein
MLATTAVNEVTIPANCASRDKVFRQRYGLSYASFELTDADLRRRSIDSNTTA